MRRNDAPTLHQRCKAVVEHDRAERAHEKAQQHHKWVTLDFQMCHAPWSRLFDAGRALAVAQSGLAWAKAQLHKYGGHR
jgi:hypothetical protein